jgi:hypothetical protein
LGKQVGSNSAAEADRLREELEAARAELAEARRTITELRRRVNGYTPASLSSSSSTPKKTASASDVRAASASSEDKAPTPLKVGSGEAVAEGSGGGVIGPVGAYGGHGGSEAEEEAGVTTPSPGAAKRQWLDRVRDEDELAVTVVVADALPKVVPNVLIQKRDELLPVRAYGELPGLLKRTERSIFSWHSPERLISSLLLARRRRYTPSALAEMQKCRNAEMRFASERVRVSKAPCPIRVIPFHRPCQG